MSRLIIFPGQGAQYGGMAKDLYENNDKARAVLDEIFSYVDFDLKEIMFTEEDQRLNDTQYTQPAYWLRLSWLEIISSDTRLVNCRHLYMQV